MYVNFWLLIVFLSCRRSGRNSQMLARASLVWCLVFIILKSWYETGNMKEEQYSPTKRSKTTLLVPVEGQGERGRKRQPFERTQELVDSRTWFRIVAVDGGISSCHYQGLYAIVNVETPRIVVSIKLLEPKLPSPTCRCKYICQWLPIPIWVRAKNTIMQCNRKRNRRLCWSAR